MHTLHNEFGCDQNQLSSFDLFASSVSIQSHMRNKLSQCLENIPHKNIYPERWELFKRSAACLRAMHPTKSLINPHDCSRAFSENMEQYIASLRGSKSFTELVKDSGFSVYEELRTFDQKYNLWKLCEILYFCGDPEEVKTTKLLSLVNTVDRSYLKYDIQEINSYRPPWNHRDFWPMIYKFVLRRKLQDICQFIQQLHTSDPVLALLLEALRDAPTIPQRHSAPSNQKFTQELQRWHQHLDTIHERTQHAMSVQSQQPSAHWQQLLDVLSILRADGPTIVRRADTATEAVIAYVVYSNALASVSDIQQAAKRMTVSTCNIHQIDERKVNAFAWMLQGRVCEALEAFPFTDWWLLTHMLHLFDLVDMRYVGDTLVHVPSTHPKDNASMSFRDLVILMHTRDLNTRLDLWEYSLDYLGGCDCRKDHHVGLLNCIQHMPERNPDAIQRLLDYCIRYDDAISVAEIFKTAKDHNIESKTFVDAAEYLRLTGDHDAFESLSDAAVRNYTRTGCLIDFKVFEPAQMDRDWYLPKTRFYLEFQKWHRIEKFPQESIDMLYDLLISEETPVDYIPLLFLEGMSVLEDSSDVDLSKHQSATFQSILDSFQTMDEHNRGFELVASYLQRVSGEALPSVNDQLDLHLKTFVDFGSVLVSRYS